MYKRLREFEEICKMFHEFDEIEISKAKLYRWLWIARRKTLKTYVWISSKNSASGPPVTFYLASEYSMSLWTKRSSFIFCWWLSFLTWGSLEKYVFCLPLLFFWRTIYHTARMQFKVVKVHLLWKQMYVVLLAGYSFRVTCGETLGWHHLTYSSVGTISAFKLGTSSE